MRTHGWRAGVRLDTADLSTGPRSLRLRRASGRSFSLCWIHVSGFTFLKPFLSETQCSDASLSAPVFLCLKGGSLTR